MSAISFGRTRPAFPPDVRVVTVRGEDLATEESFHATLARALQFPDYYGRNLDALADCLADLGEERIALVVEECAPLWRRAPHLGGALIAACRDATEAGVALELVFVG